MVQIIKDEASIYLASMNISKETNLRTDVINFKNYFLHPGLCSFVARGDLKTPAVCAVT